MTIEASESALTGIALTRRHFIKLTAMIGGGLLVSCGSSRAPDDGDPSTPVPHDGDGTQIGDFIRIDSDNRVTVLVGATEIGQGILTGIAMVVAEELDADWSLVRAEHSPVAAPYNNPYFFRVVQGTLSSSSIRGYYASQREIGAIVRQLLIETAADRWAVDPSTLITRNSYVIDPVSERSVSYGNLAVDAATRRVPSSAPLKDPSRFNLIGTDRERLDATQQVNGALKYGMDFEIPGLLTAVVARPPRFFGEALTVDDSATLAVPGVREVHRTSIGVAVVADNYWAAEQGRRALSITWTDLLAGRTDSARQRNTYESLLNLPGVPIRNDGEVTTAQLQADETLGADYYFPFQAHAAMEPLNVTVDYDGRRARIWAGTQSPTLDRIFASVILGLLPTQVELFTLPAGGGFGRRGSWLADFVRDACQVARAVRRPVKLVWSREDDMRGGFYRPMATVRVGASIDRDRQITAWTHKSVVQDITALAATESIIDSVTALMGRRPEPLQDIIRFDKNFAYSVRNVRMSILLDANLRMPALYMRGVNKVTDVFAQETFFDVVASRVGRDPYELRRALLEGKPRQQAVLDAAAQASGWTEAAGPGAQGQRARGIAVLGHWDSYIAQVVDLSVSEGKVITIHRITSAVDCGTVVNPDLVRAQIESAVMFALSSVAFGELTLVDGVVQQGNYDGYRVLRMFEAPQVETVLVRSSEPPGGVGELGVPCVAPALANAIFAAIGETIRELPLRNLGYRLGEQHPMPEPAR